MLERIPDLKKKKYKIISMFSEKVGAEAAKSQFYIQMPEIWCVYIFCTYKYL